MFQRFKKNYFCVYFFEKDTAKILKGFTLIRTLLRKNLDCINQGFTLIELLVAAAVIGIISVLSVNILYSSVLSRARQDSIQSSSEDVRNFVGFLTKSVHEAKSISISSPTEIRFIRSDGKNCRTIYLYNKNIRMAEDTSDPCTLQTPNPSTDQFITSLATEVNSPGGSIPPIFSQSGSSYILNISGVTKDSFGKHDFSYTTTIVPRI